MANELVPGLFTDQLSYEILDANGVVVDSTVYGRKIAIPYDAAMKLKYLRLQAMLSDDTSAYKKLSAAKSAEEASAMIDEALA